MDCRERIVRDPAVCGGEPVFKGTRVSLRTMLASLAEGDSVDEILRAYPSLTADDVRAAIAFAAQAASDDVPAPPSRASDAHQAGREHPQCFVVATDRKLRIRKPK